MKIENSNIEDLEAIIELYEVAREFQRSKNAIVIWPDFSKEMLISEIENQQQWKIIIDNELVCVWATTFNDQSIWGNRDKNDSIFIHRIATHHKFKGNNATKIIVDWAKKYASANAKKYVRLDTMKENFGLIKYYIGCGFNYLGMFDIPFTENLPEHYHDGKVALFEIEI